MKEFKKIEEKVANYRKTNRRQIVSLSLALLLVGGGFVLWGVNGLNGREISASSLEDQTPLSSHEPGVLSSDIAKAEQSNGQLKLESGWNLVGADVLVGDNFADLLKYGFFIYSYNDPNFPNQDWTVFSLEGMSKIGGESAFSAVNPLGYFLYNSIDSVVSVPISSTSASSTKNIGRGWHLLYFDGQTEVAKSELLELISLEYSDGTKITAAQAASDKYHRISSKIYIVSGEHDVSSTGTLELTDSNSETTADRIAPGEYFWLYTRRTQANLSKINIGGLGIISDTEKAQIDAWIKLNDLTQCGDPAGMVYTGGSCLFDEATGIEKNKYEYLVAKFLDKPWSALSMPTPTLTAITTCATDKNYENSAVEPVTCACPPGFAFKVVSIKTGQCPQGGKTDCPVSVLKCVNE